MSAPHRPSQQRQDLTAPSRAAGAFPPGLTAPPPTPPKSTRFHPLQCLSAPGLPPAGPHPFRAPSALCPKRRTRVGSRPHSSHDLHPPFRPGVGWGGWGFGMSLWGNVLVGGGGGALRADHVRMLRCLPQARGVCPRKSIKPKTQSTYGPACSPLPIPGCKQVFRFWGVPN